jgi:hypothetical protein
MYPFDALVSHMKPYTCWISTRGPELGTRSLGTFRALTPILICIYAPSLETREIRELIIEIDFNTKIILETCKMHIKFILIPF